MSRFQPRRLLLPIAAPLVAVVVGLDAGGLGLVVAARFLEAEGVQAQHVGPERVLVAPGRQDAHDPFAKGLRIATVEIEQMTPLQSERVARVVADRLKSAAGNFNGASEDGRTKRMGQAW